MPHLRSKLFGAGLALLGLTNVAASPFSSWHRSNPSSPCPSFNGTFTIEGYTLYPENGDWDPVHCKLYLSANFNATALVYDPYTTEYEILTFEGITNTDPFHISGIDYDPYTKSIMMSANSGMPFETLGGDMSGENIVIRYDTSTQSVVYQVSLADFEADIKAVSSTAGGFQDFAEDSKGNTYVPTVFGLPSVAKISPDGRVSTWYIEQTPYTPTETNSYVYLGVVYHAATSKLIVSASHLGIFVSFDVDAAIPAPTNLTMTGWPSGYSTAQCDGLLNPARYNHNVLLCSEDGLGLITVWATRDDFASVEYIGQVANEDPLADNGFPVATVQITESMYIINEYFSDTGVWDKPGNRTSFPVIEITAELDAIVEAAGFTINPDY